MGKKYSKGRSEAADHIGRKKNKKIEERKVDENTEVLNPLACFSLNSIFLLVNAL